MPAEHGPIDDQEQPENSDRVAQVFKETAHAVATSRERVSMVVQQAAGSCGASVIAYREFPLANQMPDRASSVSDVARDWETALILNAKLRKLTTNQWSWQPVSQIPADDSFAPAALSVAQSRPAVVCLHHSVRVCW